MLTLAGSLCMNISDGRDYSEVAARPMCERIVSLFLRGRSSSLGPMEITHVTIISSGNDSSMFVVDELQYTHSIHLCGDKNW
jgi:hypothetical protein